MVSVLTLAALFGSGAGTLSRAAGVGGTDTSGAGGGGQLSQLDQGATTNWGGPFEAAQQSPRVNLGPASDWDFTIGLGAAAHPEYPGSGKTSISPVPLLSVTYLGRVFVSTTEGLGVYVWRSPSLQVGAAFNIAGDTRYAGKNAELRGLPKIKPGGQARLFASYEAGPITLAADLKQRIGPVNGISADVAVNYNVRLSPSWSAEFGPSLTFASANLNNAFFGVTDQDAQNAAKYGNIIKPYRPGAGVQRVSFNVTSTYKLNEHWGIVTRLGLDLLVGRAGASPITRQRFQPIMASLFYYKF